MLKMVPCQPSRSLFKFNNYIIYNGLRDTEYFSDFMRAQLETVARLSAHQLWSNTESTSLLCYACGLAGLTEWRQVKEHGRIQVDRRYAKYSSQDLADDDAGGARMVLRTGISGGRARDWRERFGGEAGA